MFLPTGCPLHRRNLLGVCGDITRVVYPKPFVFLTRIQTYLRNDLEAIGALDLFFDDGTLETIGDRALAADADQLQIRSLTLTSPVVELRM